MQEGGVIDRQRLQRLILAEEQTYQQDHPKSLHLYKQAQECLLAGVPMHWMVRSAGRFPVFVTEGSGSHFHCVDGKIYIDFCLGDTGAMTGHAPAPAVKAIAERASKGVTFMLPTEDAVWVGRELQGRFGLKYWQFALTATDANRFSIRPARRITGRSKVLVVEFNDVPALEEALAGRDVACVLAEPVMTNIGIIHPDPGYHMALREICSRTGTLLIIDETHTICAGPGGYTRAAGLEPDIFVLAKPIAGGVPVAVYGFSEGMAAQLAGQIHDDESDTGGIGGTLAGNALSMAAMRATLEHVLTEDAFRHTIALAKCFEVGVQGVIAQHRLPWIVKRLGCRVEYWFRPTPPHNGGEAAAAVDVELDRFMHLAALNCGIMMTPFNNMALLAPITTAKDVDRHTEVFRECVELLLLAGGTPASRL